MLKDYQRQFIELAVTHQVLKFGQFTLKSGRQSPYFFNAGGFNSGGALARLGHCYAQAIIDRQIQYDVLFGPAYKGIPLVSATAIALSTEVGEDRPYCFNRKEAKAHGEGGALVGAPLRGRVLVVDDVITAGTAIREVLDIVAAQGARTVGVLVGLDRRERGLGRYSAIQELEQEKGISVTSIVDINDVMAYIRSLDTEREVLTRMEAYQARYGV